MAMPVAQQMISEESRPSKRKHSLRGSMRKYARGQEVRVKIRTGEWRNGHIVDFGNQDLLPLYWVTIDGTAEQALAFECELSSGDHD